MEDRLVISGHLEERVGEGGGYKMAKWEILVVLELFSILIVAVAMYTGGKLYRV